jgi:hypothetical protein
MSEDVRANAVILRGELEWRLKIARSYGAFGRDRRSRTSSTARSAWSVCLFCGRQARHRSPDLKHDPRSEDRVGRSERVALTPSTSLSRRDLNANRRRRWSHRARGFSIEHGREIDAILSARVNLAVRPLNAPRAQRRPAARGLPAGHGRPAQLPRVMTTDRARQRVAPLDAMVLSAVAAKTRRLDTPRDEQDRRKASAGTTRRRGFKASVSWYSSSRASFHTVAQAGRSTRST